MDTETTSPVELGFGMQGIGPQVLPYILQVCEQFTSVTYMEIGIAEGATLAAISEVRRDNKENWRAIGVDLPDGYSLNQHAVSKNAKKKHLIAGIESHFGKTAVRPSWQRITVYLKDSHTFLPENWSNLIQLALIDGCHCKQCFTTDFLLIEPFIEPGGILMMHDFGVSSLKFDNPRGHGLFAVRTAAREMGLLDNKRPGWEFIEEMLCSDRGGGNMGIFQKMKI